MGAAEGRDSEAVKQGLACLAAQDGGSAASFRRLQSPELPVQRALLVLRHAQCPSSTTCCAAHIPPASRSRQPTSVTAAYDKLELRSDERTAKVEQRQRLRLRDGGFGLASAVQTSSVAYIASLVAARDTAVFAPFRSAVQPLPANSLLHGWLTDSMTRLRAPRPLQSWTPSCRRPPLPSSPLSRCSLRPDVLSPKLLQRSGQRPQPRGLSDCSPTAETAGRRQATGSLHCLLRAARLGVERAAPTQPLTTRAAVTKLSAVDSSAAFDHAIAALMERVKVGATGQRGRWRCQLCTSTSATCASTSVRRQRRGRGRKRKRRRNEVEGGSRVAWMRSV